MMSVPYPDLPDFIAVSGLLKASPREEDGQRFIYFEASNETLDQQGEKVLAQALADSAALFLAHGNIDIDHETQLRRQADWLLYEIGRPVDVRIAAGATFVKAQLYQGDTDLARNANLVWDSLTRLTPPARWYPSVGGAVLDKGYEIDPESKARIALIKKVRWTNVALSRTPVNQAVPVVQTVPVGALAKCQTAAGLNWSKALEAGYGTDVSTLTGGAALRRQSLDSRIQSYWTFRDRFAEDLRRQKVKVEKQDPQPLHDYIVRTYHLNHDDAADYLERFFGDLHRHRRRSALTRTAT